MPAEAGLAVLRPGRVLVDHGPVTMTIDAGRNGEPCTDAAIAGARRALRALDELTPVLHLARREVGRLGPLPPDAPDVLALMVAAVRCLDEPDFTPMAAVAGTFAELALGAALAAGADRVIANNGGDIALAAPAGQTVRVGIISDLAARRVTHTLAVADGTAGGVATSGFGGRSLTKGIASAAVAVARSASVADALATAIGNAATVDHPAIERCLARDLDPGTDIAGHTVTRSVGPLPAEVRRQAVAAAHSRAWELHWSGHLLAWAVFVGDEMACYPPDLVAPLPKRVEDQRW